MRKLLVVAIVIAAAAAGLAAADTTLAVSFGPVQEMLQAKCASCHDWASVTEGIAERVTPGAPDESAIWQKVAKNLMPPGEPLATAEKALLKDWIAAGAPTGGAAGGDAAGADTAAADATSGATSEEGEQAPSTFLGFKSKTAFHMATGYTSTALFLGAGIVGAVQWGTLMYESHEYRDANHIEEDQISTACASYIAALRDDPLHSALRWTHVGLLSAAEVLYLADAITGISMLTKDRPGLTPQDIHRYAFFTHAALMISELALGIASSAFLDLGDHESIVGVGIAHTAVGFAIPVIMLSAGIYINSVFR
jgi:hypothetical protein